MPRGPKGLIRHRRHDRTVTLCTFDRLDSRNADDMSVKMGSGLRESSSGGTAANGPPGLADAFSCPDGPRPGPKRTSTAEMARPAAISAHTVSHSTPSSMSAMRSAIETVGFLRQSSGLLYFLVLRVLARRASRILCS